MATAMAAETYNDKVVRQFAIATLVWGIIGMLVGVVIAAQLYWPDFLGGISWLSYGRLRPLHTNAVIFAFGGSALFATSYWCVQRTSHARLFCDKLAAFTFWGWQLVLVGYGAGLVQDLVGSGVLGSHALALAAAALVASLVVMVAMWPSTYSVIEANPILHALQHGFYIVVAALGTFTGYQFARSAGWIMGVMMVVMAWAAAFGFGVNPGPSPLIAQVAAMPAVASGGSSAAAYQNCVACHMADGGGMPGVFPPLAGHVPALLAADGGQEYMVRVVLYGLQGQIMVAGSSYAGAMPGWGHLSDDDLAAALNHVSSTWGELPATASAPFSAADVQAARGTQLTPQQVHELREGLGLP